ncbi:MAG: chromosome partitioning protein ParB [Solirubrobacteraceae bacterium]
MSTYYESQAGGDFDRERRRRAFRRISTRLRQAPDDVDEMLPFDEVVVALGSGARRDLGIQTIPLDSIVGTVDRQRAEFDRAFRPMTGELRDRWQRVATARRSGVALPPIDVYRVGGLHFVEDGHHRVSVARALGDDTIEARVREISTSVGASPDLRASELPLKQHERIFFERVPLPQGLRHRVRLTDEWRYAQLATLVEAGGFRESHARGRLLAREELAEQWYHDQFEPIVAAMREAGIGGPGTDADRYLRFVMLRFLLLYTTDWSDEVIERLIHEVRPPRPEDDTAVHQILTEMHSGPSPTKDDAPE